MGLWLAAARFSGVAFAAGACDKAIYSCAIAC